MAALPSLSILVLDPVQHLFWGAGVIFVAVTCGDVQGLGAVLLLGKQQELSRAIIPHARRSPVAAKEQWWADMDGMSDLGHWYLPFLGKVIGSTWQKSMLGTEPASLGQAHFSSSLWSSS